MLAAWALPVLGSTCLLANRLLCRLNCPCGRAATSRAGAAAGDTGAGLHTAVSAAIFDAEFLDSRVVLVPSSD